MCQHTATPVSKARSQRTRSKGLHIDAAADRGVLAPCGQPHVHAESGISSRRPTTVEGGVFVFLFVPPVTRAPTSSPR